MAALVHSITSSSISYNSLRTEVSLTQINTHTLSAGWTKISFYFIPDPNRCYYWSVSVPSTVADFPRGSFFKSMKLGRALRGGTSLPPAHVPAVVSCAKLGITSWLLSFALLLPLSGPLPLSFFMSRLPPTLALWQSLLAERFNSPKPEENRPCFCCLSCQLGMLSWVMEGGAKMKWWENMAESGQGGRFVKGEQDLPP